MKRAMMKVPGGKLLKVALMCEGGVISSISITGDFFLYPEEKLNMIEEVIAGKKIDQIETSVNDILDTEGIEVFGFSVDDLVSVIEQAIKSDAVEGDGTHSGEGGENNG